MGTGKGVKCPKLTMSSHLEPFYLFQPMKPPCLSIPWLGAKEFSFPGPMQDTQMTRSAPTVAP